MSRFRFLKFFFYAVSKTALIPLVSPTLSKTESQDVQTELLHYHLLFHPDQMVTIFIKPFFYERFLDWHNTRFNGLTHIFFRLVGRLLLTCKNMPHVKILEHISSSIFQSSW